MLINYLSRTAPAKPPKSPNAALQQLFIIIQLVFVQPLNRFAMVAAAYPPAGSAIPFSGSPRSPRHIGVPDHGTEALGGAY
jgi:hypothetical protein